MRVIADEKKRVVLPAVKPSNCFDVQTPSEGTFILTRVEPNPSVSSEVRIEKRGLFTVGILDRPMDEQALREALSK